MFGLQLARVLHMRECVTRYGPDSLDCQSYPIELGWVLGEYAAINMAIGTADFGGAGSMLGYAAASNDAELERRFRRRRGAFALGLVGVIGSASWLVVSNWWLFTNDRCDDAGCMLRFMQLRYTANDIGVIALGTSTGLLGYAIAYNRQGRALMKLQGLPVATRSGPGLSLSGRF